MMTVPGRSGSLIVTVSGRGASREEAEVAIGVRYHDYGEVGSRLRAVVDRRIASLDETLSGIPGTKTLYIDVHYDLREDSIHVHLTLDCGADRLRADGSAQDRAVALTSAFSALQRAARAKAGEPVPA